jgi:hypothetical protein
MIDKITYDEKDSLQYWAREDRLHNISPELMEKLKVHNPDVAHFIEDVARKEQALEHTKKALELLIYKIDAE